MGGDFDFKRGEKRPTKVSSSRLRREIDVQEKARQEGRDPDEALRQLYAERGHPDTKPILEGEVPEEEADSISAEERHARDRALRPEGFKFWLMNESDGTYEPLREAINSDPNTFAKFPVKFDASEWMAALDYDDELCSLLSRAEAEWRFENLSRGKTNQKLAVTAVPSMDFHSPHPSIKGCRHRNESSKPPCGRPVIPGTVRCEKHGGELVDASTRRAVLMSSYLQLVEATTTAVKALESVASSSRNDVARVMAAKEILDRAGITPEHQLTINVATESREDRMLKLQEKLSAMREGIVNQAIEAHVVEESTNGDRDE